MNEVYEQIERHIPDLRRYARAITRNPVAADDLLQESLSRALTKSHLYRPGTNLRAWLFTILHNRHISDIRRNGRMGVAVDPDDVASALATRPNQESGLLMQSVARALDALPESQRLLIELVALDGQSYEEAADTCGLPLGTVKSRISRGRRHMRRYLDGEPANQDPAVGRPRPRAYRRTRRSGALAGGRTPLAGPHASLPSAA